MGGTGQEAWTWVESDEMKLVESSPHSGTILALEGPVNEGLPRPGRGWWTDLNLMSWPLGMKPPQVFGKIRKRKVSVAYGYKVPNCCLS